MSSAGASAWVTGGPRHTSATAGSGTLGPVTLACASCVRGGSRSVTRGTGVVGAVSGPKWRSTQPSSWAGSTSPTTISTALSGR